MAPRNPLKHLWGSEKGLSAMLVFLGLTLFLGLPLADTVGGGGVYVFDVLFALIFVSGIVTIAHRPWLTATASAMAVATLALRWASPARAPSALRLWSDVLAVLLLLILIFLVLVQVFREGPITGYRIQGAIVVYMLMGVGWAVAYQVVLHLAPGAFSFAQTPPTAGLMERALIYYSYVTLTTVGYGDITPLHPFARSLAMAEALTGQLYPAILIARLVSLRVESRKRS